MLNQTPIRKACLLLAFVFTIASCAEIIPPDRRIDWSSVGIPGGIPARTTISTTINAITYGNGTTDATAAIQNALNSCPGGQVVILPAGTYRVSKTINCRSNTTLRGAGMGGTILNYTDTAGRSVLDMRGLANWDIEGRKRSFSIIEGLSKGSTRITLSGATGIAVGDILLIDQLNDGVLVDINGLEGACTYCGRANGTRAQGQFAEVTGINGATYTLNLPLFWTLSATLTPQATLVDATSMVRNAGIEDLTITQTTPAVDFMIEMDAAQYCWLKGVELTRIKRRAVWLIESLQNEIRQCYFHDGIGGYGRDRGYALLADAYATHNLIEDNIFSTLDGGFMMCAGGAAGNVFGYNFMVDSRFDDPWWLTQSPCMSHAPHPSMNLWEGNIGIQAGADFIHGSSSHNTMFRCRSTGWQSAAITANNNAIEIQYKNTYYNVLGCVLGTAGQSSRYEHAYPAQSNTDLKTIWRLGYGGPNNLGDTIARATLIRHGNYDYVNNATIWDPGNSDHTLPPSLYRTSKPPFFGNLAWPAIGPDCIPLTGTIPAQERSARIHADVGPSQEIAQHGQSPWVTVSKAQGVIRITFSTPFISPVSLGVYSLDGRLVAGLLKNQAGSGIRTVEWESRAMAGGVYAIAFRSGGGVVVRRVVVWR
jgi:hypothetical protein